MIHYSHLEDNFFNRQSIIDLLKRRVIDLKDGYRQNIAFLGTRYIGKTSILRRFMRDLDDEDIIEIYMDCEQKDFYYFFHKFTGSILYQFARKKGLILHDDLGLLLEVSKKYIPQTVEEIKKIQASLHKGKISECYRDLISLPEIFTIESGKFCMIVIDEFHHIEQWDLGGVFQELGKKIMTQKRCIYIVTSSLGDVAKQILSEKLSLLFGHFEVITIETFEVKESQEFIEHNLKEISIGPVLKNFLIDFTGGHPFYLNIICQELISLCTMYQQREIYLPLFIKALEQTIFLRWGILSRHFDLLMHHLSLGKGNEIIPRLLIQLAKGKNKLKELNECPELKKCFLSKKLKILIDLGMVGKNGNVYHIQDKLLKYWIKYVLRRRLSNLGSYPQQQRENFQKEIKNHIQEFHVAFRKDFSARIIELLHCFDNEAFQINGRRYRLPLFRNVSPYDCDHFSSGNVHIIKAESSQELWFLILKEEALQEGEVNDFLAELKGVKKKPQRRVIVSLSDLEANARLRALQEKVWIWNEGELNVLLNLYDKPYIMK